MNMISKALIGGALATGTIAAGILGVVAANADTANEQTKPSYSQTENHKQTKPVTGATSEPAAGASDAAGNDRGVSTETSTNPNWVDDGSHKPGDSEPAQSVAK